MSNSLFDAGRQGFLDGSIDWDTHDIRLVFVDHSDDTPNLVTDDNIDDIASAARIANSEATTPFSANFTGKTVAAGVANASNVTVQGVTGDIFESVVILKWTGVESSSRLIAYIDTATGLPLTPTGGTVTVSWDTGPLKIFRL